MNGIERMTRQLNHQSVDRIAVSEEFWGLTVPHWVAEEGLLASSTIVSNGTLDEMTRVVELVRVDLLPLMSTPPTAQARTFISNARRQIAVGLLSLGNDVNH